MLVERSAAAVVVHAPAKLNLFLEVTGKRPDGYHDLQSLMVAVGLYDTLECSPDRSGGLALTCDAPDLSCGPDNLVLRAAEVLRRHTGYAGGARLHLAKRIPMQAGMAGGSSDAAAALAGLNRLWNLDLPAAELARLGAAVGSDVAFFFAPSPAAWCTGRGEVVEPERVGGPLWFVVAKPPVGLSTAAVFRELTLPDVPVPGDEIRAAVRAGDVERIARGLHNRLSEPAERLAPEVAALRRAVLDAGAAGALMTGSGSAVFGLCRDRTEAHRVASALAAAGRTRVEIVRNCV